MKKLSTKSQDRLTLSKITLSASLCVLLVGLAACQNDNTLKAQDANGGTELPNGNPPEKPTSGRPPQVDSSKLKVGTSWVWQKNSTSAAKPTCQQWTVVDATTSGVVVEIRTNTSACDSFPGPNWMRYQFDPNDGRIFRIEFSDGKWSEGKDQSVNDHLYLDGSDKTYLRKNIVLGKNIYRAFQIQGSKSWYADTPEESTHGVLLLNADWTLRP